MHVGVFFILYFIKTDNLRLSTGKIDECGGSCVLTVDPIANGIHTGYRYIHTVVIE